MASFAAFLNGDWRLGSQLPQSADDVGFFDEAAADGCEPERSAIVQISNPARIGQDADEAPFMTVPGFNWTSAGQTDVGKRRSINEDAFLDRGQDGLWVVADGMGGHQAGDIASRMIVDNLRKVDLTGDLKEATRKVRTTLQTVNSRLCSLSTEKYNNQIVGSTVVTLIGRANQCVYLWAGDSRLYCYRAGRLIQLTRDHSCYDELALDDLLQSDDIDRQNHSNIITRAIGAEQELELDRDTRAVEEDDIFLLCSDGLTKEVSPPEIGQILSQGTCQDSTEALINLALARGARDNVTVVVVEAKVIG